MGRTLISVHVKIRCISCGPQHVHEQDAGNELLPSWTLLWGSIHSWSNCPVQPAASPLCSPNFCPLHMLWGSIPQQAAVQRICVWGPVIMIMSTACSVMPFCPFTNSYFFQMLRTLHSTPWRMLSKDLNISLDFILSRTTQSNSVSWMWCSNGMHVKDTSMNCLCKS